MELGPQVLLQKVNADVPVALAPYGLRPDPPHAQGSRLRIHLAEEEERGSGSFVLERRTGIVRFDEMTGSATMILGLLYR